MISGQEAAELHAWLESGAYLPGFMRDFHDQKDLFKAIHELVNNNEGTKRVSWIDAHIYTVDVFLWFMARRGYTLQRSRAKQPFLDIHQTIADAEKLRVLALSKLLSPASLTRCAAHRDGECTHPQCPQLRDGEPTKSGRHCPLDTGEDDHD